MIETSFPQSLVKGLECKVGVTRVVEAGDDVPGLNIIVFLTIIIILGRKQKIVINYMTFDKPEDPAQVL